MRSGCSGFQASPKPSRPSLPVSCHFRRRGRDSGSPTESTVTGGAGDQPQPLTPPGVTAWASVIAEHSALTISTAASGPGRARGPSCDSGDAGPTVARARRRAAAGRRRRRRRGPALAACLLGLPPGGRAVRQCPAAADGQCQASRLPAAGREGPNSDQSQSRSATERPGRLRLPRPRRQPEPQAPSRALAAA